MSGCTRWQMLRHVYIPSARSEILVGLNQVIMLCLAMVVLTAAIGMPGLGAKLLEAMGSFKLGRAFEIGVTIVLLAVVLDRLSKAWVVNLPEHFERGTPWWRRNIFLIIGLALFAIFVGISMAVSGMKPQPLDDAGFGNWFVGILDEVHRKEALSQRRLYDSAIKDFLSLDAVTSVTETIRYVVNVYILIPTERALLFVPTLAVIFRHHGARLQDGRQGSGDTGLCLLLHRRAVRLLGPGDADAAFGVHGGAACGHPGARRLRFLRRGQKSERNARSSCATRSRPSHPMSTCCPRSCCSASRQSRSSCRS